MKIRLYLSIVLLMFWAIINNIIKFYYSPLTGVATAQSLNDNISSYTWAKFIRDGGLNNGINYITIGLFLIIWISYIFKSEKKNIN